MLVLLCLVIAFASAMGGPSTESYKDQFCTDPRTMKKHAAYTEWADAYSCTRHRCQPGGRNLAIYTVGCKRVEAPESAIECEEVVEDTNMQFPYCCTRLRCLVVVRGEVWTRVLGQPWETLPAAPWSHMYKMKKPPPGESGFLPKTPGEGPIYELTSDVEGEKVLRAKKPASDPADCNEVAQRSVPAPDIVIALSTANDVKDHKTDTKRHKLGRKVQNSSPYYEEEALEHRNEIEVDEPAKEKDKTPDVTSEEKVYTNAYGVTQKPFKSHHHVSWTEVPPIQWNEHESPGDSEPTVRDGSIPQVQPEEKTEEKPSNLQALVDAIGTRMRDIENVVQRMSEKVHQAKPELPDVSGEKRSLADVEIQALQHLRKHKKGRKEENTEFKAKKPNPDNDHYKRSKYLHTADGTTEQPLYVEDNALNGYFSDASNSVLRRANPPKEPAQTYMAPVDTRRKAAHTLVSELSDEEKTRKKHGHKKRRGKSRSHKKHRKEEKKHQNKLSSVELEKNVISLEDSGAVVSA